MTRLQRINILLAVAILICILLIRNSGRDVSRTNLEYMPDMARSIAAESQARNPLLPLGMTLQAPPEGTIARGRLPFRYEATVADAERAGRELQSPITATDEKARQRGAASYASFCQPCHGSQGRGDGPVAARGFPPPPSLLADAARALADGQIFHVISRGKGNMPAHGGQIDVSTRWDILAHVRALQERSKADATPTTTADSTAATESGEMDR